MFEKILIANRGEIACRVMRTAGRLGIRTVAVYSEADRDALHVETADEAVCIGAAPSAESYLRIESIVEACRSTGAEAVHPGYGFLSENAAFAEALEAQGIRFIGPPAPAIRSMGDKIASKRIAREAGVNTIPGYMEVLRDADDAARAAAEIGYPVMLKASAGGGGKGMRVARDERECRDGFERARSEARSSFGDERVLVEKFISEPRHVEIQVMADGHGNVVHLGERECSIQRRHQKIIEESPSPVVDAEMRSAMGAQAVALARAVEYRSAGTVEFIVDAERGFYFLEMNTRLQVEHPVTECVTGLDLVELMIRVAAGERLALRQEDVTISGWAVEARIYAEDPARDFMPSIGRVQRFLAPAERGGVRLDTGIVEGGEVSVYYDPLIAKLIAHGPTRNAAVDRLREALDELYLRGVSHNVDFLSAILGHPRFREGRLSTNFIDEEFPDGYDPRRVSESGWRVFVAVAAAVQHRLARRDRLVSGRMNGRTPRSPGDWVVFHDGARSRVRVTSGESWDEVWFGAEPVRVTSGWTPGETLFRGDIDGAPVCVQIERAGVGFRLAARGSALEVSVMRPRAAELAELMPAKAVADTTRYLLAPMPGLLVSVSAQPGEEVKAGQELAIVEAMKMENVLRALEDRRVAAILASPGESLSVDQPIIEFE